MIRPRPLVAHLTTTDISLALLLREQLEAFSESGFDVVGISAPGPFVDQLVGAGIPHVPLFSATRRLSASADFRAVVELWKVLRELRPDIVHTHNPKTGVYGRVLAAMSGVPVVVNTVHGLYATRTDPALKRFAVYLVERVAALFSDAELVQNPEDVETLRRLRVPNRKLVFLGNGVDLHRFNRTADTDEARRQIRAELGTDDSTVVVLAVGRLVGEKGYRDLFTAAQRLGETHPSAKLVVVGPREPAKVDRITDEEIRAAERAGALVLGHRHDVEKLYTAADIYVLASHREGFPRSAMEAAAMGLPIVATDIRGCRQVVDHGRTGLLVSPRDPTALASAIGRLVESAEERKRMGELAAQRATTQFDQARVIQLTIDTYRHLLGRMPTGPVARRPPATAIDDESDVESRQSADPG